MKAQRPKKKKNNLIDRRSSQLGGSTADVLLHCGGNPPLLNTNVRIASHTMSLLLRRREPRRLGHNKQINRPPLPYNDLCEGKQKKQNLANYIPDNDRTKKKHITISSRDTTNIEECRVPPGPGLIYSSVPKVLGQSGNGNKQRWWTQATSVVDTSNFGGGLLGQIELPYRPLAFKRKLEI